MRDYLDLWHERRLKKGINFRIVYNEAETNLIKTRAKMHLAKVRVLPKEFINPTAINIFGNKVAIIMWTRKPKAFLIEDKQLSNSFKNYFDLLWGIGKKPFG